MTEQQALRTYRGNCHCAAYVFEVKLPEIRYGLQCNCSYCFKRSGIVQFLKDDNIRFIRGNPATLTSYSWGTKKFKHEFCSNCGTYLFCYGSLASPDSGDEKPAVSVNLRAIQSINVWDLDVKIVDGASFPPAWIPPKFKGQGPPAEIEGAKIYTGSCHCGAITLALKSKPIDSTYKENVVECDCSICSRNGYCWVYPQKQQVTIDGWENLAYYVFGKKIWQKTFCKTCGIPIHNHMPYSAESQIPPMPEEDREWTIARFDLCPVNIHVLNDKIDLKDLFIKRLKGSILREPLYENP
ncbi:glutathione-dependent formaldehyde-activating enzyme [Whalleya microplaca]|nr:glutathione-dependent formaldehyde-activating enzyme [Whalleya microplaca]